MHAKTRRLSLGSKAAPALLAVLATLGLIAIAGDRPSAQQTRHMTTFMASGNQLAAALPRIEAMLRDGTLAIGTVQEDTMIPGHTHERLNQTYEGLPVFGGQVIRQMDGRAVVSLSGAVYDGIAIGTTPALTPEAAADRARVAGGPSAVVNKQPVLGILPREDGSYVLVYKLQARMASDIRDYYVNAQSGAIESDHSAIRTQGIIGQGTGVLGDPKKLSVISAAGTFRTDDALRPARELTFDFRGNINRLSNFLDSVTVFTSDIAVDSDNVWTDSAVVDAHVYQGLVYDYFYKRFGRRGLDDRNLEIWGIVHPIARSSASSLPPEVVGTFINNAGYFGDGIMIYGDGDGRNFDFLAGGLDVIGHELTHGVTDFSSHLDCCDEPGALNEAFSDIMGASIEYFYQPVGSGPLKADWLMGEDVTKAFPGYIRSLNNPAAIGDPDHYYSLRRFIGTQDDDGGVHFNCTIVTHAYYLAVAGGTNRVSRIGVTGIGFANRERMEKIFYRGFVFGLGPNARFSDARAATLQAATDLYGSGSNERAQLAQAWTAVGVN